MRACAPIRTPKPSPGAPPGVLRSDTLRSGRSVAHGDVQPSKARTSMDLAGCCAIESVWGFLASRPGCESKYDIQPETVVVAPGLACSVHVAVTSAGTAPDQTRMRSVGRSTGVS